MGVKYLWTVLAPFCDRKPLYSLQGKTVAVDLSCWICEAQNITEYQVQPRMYLRNLYFRTCYLLLMDVNPVFVLEGKAPELKYNTISARNAIQFKGVKPKSGTVKTGKDRTRYHFVLKQCEEMLGYLGLACIAGNGEAESLCAYLNEDGLVDGCISQDSDCFAYGAQVVYRNFSISTQGVQTASGGSVDVYDIRRANHSLSFGRNKIIAMALLIGCDYSDGVHGVGKESVLKFLETVSDDEVLDRLRSWRTDIYTYENYEKQLADKNICVSCGHGGKLQGHTKNGCASCTTSAGCDPFKYKDERLKMKNEVNMRNKAIKDPEFPNEILIKEFLDKKDAVKELDLKWKQPNVVKFLKFTGKFLQWDELYSFDKILPVLTRWQCRNPELLKDEGKLKGVLKPDRIKKMRNPKGVPSYEIIWSDPGEYFKGLVPESQILEKNIDVEKLWSTIEPQNLVESAYPRLVEDFKQSKIKPKKVGKRRKKKIGDFDAIADKLANVSISDPKSKKSKTRAGQQMAANASEASRERTKTTEEATQSCFNDLDSSFKKLTMKNTKTKTQKQIEAAVCDVNLGIKQMSIGKPKKSGENQRETLDRDVKRAVIKSYKQRANEIPSDREINISVKTIGVEDDHLSSTQVKAAKINVSFDFDLSSFGDESDSELSEIVDDIVSRKDLKDNLKDIADKYARRPDESIDVVCLDDSFNDAENEHERHKEATKNTLAIFRSRSNDDVVEETDNLLNGTEPGEYQRQASSLFINDPVTENEFCEKTFNVTFKNFDSSSDSDTDEYEYETKDSCNDKENFDFNEMCGGAFKEKCKKIVCLSSDDDDYDFSYVPLYERLKNK